MKRRLMVIVGVALLLMLSACSGGHKAASTSSSKSPTQSSGASLGADSGTAYVPPNSVSVRNGCPDPMPGDISTTEQKMLFCARPDFTFFTSCGRPCWLPLYAAPKIVLGHAVTRNFPYERYGSQSGDVVSVVCQKRGEMIRNDQLVTSDLWDLVIVLSDISPDPLMSTSGLTPVPGGGGYYAYGADLWLGNTGDHGIPCP